MVSGEPLYLKEDEKDVSCSAPARNGMAGSVWPKTHGVGRECRFPAYEGEPNPGFRADRPELFDGPLSILDGASVPGRVSCLVRYSGAGGRTLYQTDGSVPPLRLSDLDRTGSLRIPLRGAREGGGPSFESLFRDCLRSRKPGDADCLRRFFPGCSENVCTTPSANHLEAFRGGTDGLRLHLPQSRCPLRRSQLDRMVCPPRFPWQPVPGS